MSDDEYEVFTAEDGMPGIRFADKDEQIRALRQQVADLTAELGATQNQLAWLRGTIQAALYPDDAIVKSWRAQLESETTT